MNCEHVPYVVGNIVFSSGGGCNCSCHQFYSLGRAGVNCYCQCNTQITIPNQNNNEINMKIKELKVENDVLRGTIIKLQERVVSLEEWKKNVCR